MKHTPGPWMFGTWDIFDEDREAQKKGGPYWTFTESENGDSLSCGPSGRKARGPERIIDCAGYECDGIYFENQANKSLILAAPDLLESSILLNCAICEEINAVPTRVLNCLNDLRAAIAKAENNLTS